MEKGSGQMTEEEWWEEDARRLDEMAKSARELGVVVETKDLESKSEKKITKVFRKLNKKKKSDSQ